MGNLTYSGARYWEASEAASIPASTLALAQSVNDRVIGKFASGTARDSALASLTSDQRKGALLWTDGVGWTAHDGGTNREVGVRGITYHRGRTDGVIEGNGNLRIPSSACFFNGAPPAVIVGMGINELFRPTWNGLVDGSGALLRIFKQDGTAWEPGATVAIFWCAFR